MKKRYILTIVFLSTGLLSAQTPPAPGRQTQGVNRPAQRQGTPAQSQRVNRPAQRRPQSRSRIEHRWGINTAFLVQNSPFREFSIFTDGSWYVQGYRAWMAGKAGLGLSFGFSYDATFPGGGLFRTQLQLETTGWISGVLDIGGGVRVPIKNGISASVEGYFSMALSGGSLARLADHRDRQSFSVVFFGFKARGSVEFPIKKNWYSSIYISYAAYPWHGANKKSLYINGIGTGAIVDSLQIGVEFGQKF